MDGKNGDVPGAKNDYWGLCAGISKSLDKMDLILLGRTQLLTQCFPSKKGKMESNPGGKRSVHQSGGGGRPEVHGKPGRKRIAKTGNGEKDFAPNLRTDRCRREPIPHSKVTARDWKGGQKSPDRSEYEPKNTRREERKGFKRRKKREKMTVPNERAYLCIVTGLTLAQE